MMLGQFAWVKIFVTSLALAKKTGFIERPSAVNGSPENQATGNNLWQSGECINRRPRGFELEFSLNKPSICITLCKAKQFKLAGLMDKRCTCGNSIPKGGIGIDNGQCHTPCPGQPDSVCGGGNLWWNVYYTDDALGKCVDRSHLQDWVSLEDLLALIPAPTTRRILDTTAAFALRKECLTGCNISDFTMAALSDGVFDCHCGNQESAASTFARVCYRDCYNADDQDHVCLIETSKKAPTAEQSKDCVSLEDLKERSQHQKTFNIGGRSSCKKFCEKKKSMFGAIEAKESKRCFCGDQVPPATLMVISNDICETETVVEFFRIPEASGPNMEAVGLSIGAAVLVLLLVVLALVFINQRKKRKAEKEKETADFNPVYATYEVHDDPVAEAKDQNLVYGEVYEGQEMSNTTDVNPDYDDYDSTYI